MAVGMSFLEYGTWLLYFSQTGKVKVLETRMYQGIFFLITMVYLNMWLCPNNTASHE